MEQWFNFFVVPRQDDTTVTLYYERHGLFFSCRMWRDKGASGTY